MKSSQKNSQVRPVRVPEPLKGRRAAIFFLLNEIEQRKGRSKHAAQADPGSTQAAAPNETGSAPTKVFLLTDEFIFT